MRALENNKPYMIRNDGCILDCGRVHPYIIREKEQDLKEIVQNLIVINCDALWFYYNAKTESTKKLIVEIYQKLYNILLSDVDKYELIGIDDELEVYYFVGLFNLIPQKNIVVDRKYVDGLYADLVDLNDRTNQEFLRCRTGGIYTEQGRKEIYFRISSVNFDWFKIIWNVVYINRNNFCTVSIIADRQTKVNLDYDRFYVIDGKVIENYPISDFITLKGNPVVESTSSNQFLQEGKSLIEAIGDFGAYHNHIKFETKKKLYLHKYFVNGKVLQ